MKKTLPTLRSLYLSAALSLGGCVSAQTVTSVPVLNTDCSVTQKMEVKKGKSILATEKTYMGFDTTCAQQQEKQQLREKAYDIIAKYAAIELAQGEKDGENMRIILEGIGGMYNEVQRAQAQQALTDNNLSMKDLLRAQAIGLVSAAIESEEKEHAGAAMREILHLYRGEKYPELGDMPREIIAEELAKKGLNIGDVERAYAWMYAKDVTVCKQENENSELVIVCEQAPLLQF